MLTGENGLLTKVGDAKTKTIESAAYEQLDLVRSEWNMETKLNPDAVLLTFLNEQKNTGKIDNYSDEGNGNYSITKDGYQRTIKDIVFYIYHSADNTVDRIRWDGNGSFNICNYVNQKCVYGGYYRNYGGKGSYASDGVEVFDGTEIAYNGYNVTWNENDVYEEKGTEIEPENGVTYYLKEVPRPYLECKFHNSYSGVNQTIASEWGIICVDDLNYNNVGFIVNSNERIEVENVYKNLNLTIGGSTRLINSENKFGVDGFIGWRKIFEYVVENAEVTYCPYWVTKDNVLVEGKYRARANYGNCNLQGEGHATLKMERNT